MKNTLIFLLGIIVLLLAVFLDKLGLKTHEGFGLVQIIGVIIGAILIIFSLVKMGKKKKEA